MAHPDEVDRYVGDEFKALDQVERDRFAWMVGWLDLQNAAPSMQQVKQRMIELLSLHEGAAVLDVGCGTGDDTRALAQVAGAHGRAVGVDFSEEMLAEARRRATGAPFTPEFVQGDAHQLPFPDEMFDACRAERMIMHLANPEQAIAEMARVTKPGGSVVACEPDWGAVSVVTRETDLWNQLAHESPTRGQRIGRELPALFAASGLTEIVVEPALLVLDAPGLGRIRRQQGCPPPPLLDAHKRGVLSESDYDRAVNDLYELIDAGLACQAVVLFVVAGVK